MAAALPAEAQLDGLLDLDPHLEPYCKDLQRRYDKFRSLARSIEENEGNLDQFSRSYESFGVNRLADGGVYCKEWAPGAKSVSLVGEFNGWNSSSHHYKMLPFGKWELHIPPRADGSSPIPHGSKLKMSKPAETNLHINPFRNLVY